eukprot:CAMPEP_0204146322 /NCGR_PEP_ID=MMETSP0361-20130328/22078_1 /ASSEMBLY_ACC=CAM_ASM_000343 /TAXON_ID=268821 /ORGANISM="Scrippsiella Hangoei, Strain SHTV-5" /LENGTH=31 /DNA_ID= /DNA_START= /DNA_END= /DNA_ORIENTATION=
MTRTMTRTARARPGASLTQCRPWARQERVCI